MSRPSVHVLKRRLHDASDDAANVAPHQLMRTCKHRMMDDLDESLDESAPTVMGINGVARRTKGGLHTKSK